MTNTTQSNDKQNGVNVWLGFTILWPVLCCIVSVLWVNYRLRGIEADVAARPPIAVLPVDELVLEDIAKTKSPDPQPSVIKVRAMGDRLADAGYVVLNTSVVYAAPKQFEARPGAGK